MYQILYLKNFLGGGEGGTDILTVIKCPFNMVGV